VRHRLLKVATIPRLFAEAYRLDGTDRFVLELVMFGFACASRYVLLRSALDLSRLDDPDYMKDIGDRSSRYGRVLRWDVDLFLDADDGSVSVELH